MLPQPHTDMAEQCVNVFMCVANHEEAKFNLHREVSKFHLIREHQSIKYTKYKYALDAPYLPQFSGFPLVIMRLAGHSKQEVRVYVC